MAKRILKKKMPCVVLNKMAILPGMVIHFDLTRDNSIKSVEEAMKKDKKIVIAYADGYDKENDTTQVIEEGTICDIKQVVKMPKNLVRVLVSGLKRAEILNVSAGDGKAFVSESTIAEIKPVEIEDDWEINPELKPLAEELTGDINQTMVDISSRISILKELVNVYSKLNPQIGKNLSDKIDETQLCSELVDRIGSTIPMDYKDRMLLLENISLIDRLDKLIAILGKYINISKTKAQIVLKTKENVEKNQKKYYLREQMKVIKDQLRDEGEEADEDGEIAVLKSKVKKLKASASVKERLNKEIDRLGRLNDGSSEAEVSRGYIETLLAMPWDKMSKDNNDINRAEEILNEDHYGLDKVKERVLEFLSVRNLTKKGDSPIMCLVGPPGTGKTSIAKSVARALDKKYVRICLGGVRDEAEIRGHRRTYVGALPGKIAMGMKTAGVKNPLILLDEIDKLGNDHKGDPSSAMLEVLDPEQNCAFSDHYIELPIDLSEVLFIATANSVSDIPRPLLDRMEIIEVSSYTENEKIHIAKDYLFPKVIEKNGLGTEQLIIADTVWTELIDGYTREAGVREAERKIGEICRKTARKIYQDGKKSVRINRGNLEEFLGKRKYRKDHVNEKDEIGIVRGLAWTRVGGDTLSIEVNSMPGRGEMILTGQLGDVMKESAMTGMSFVRSIAAEKGIKDTYFKKHDFHIHIPEGSVPKDGPSAGITMATALYSVVTDKKVRADVAMTGEITLRGRVLPIGGLKEKLLAAKNAGIKKVLVPIDNEKDVDEIDKEITDGLAIVFVSSMDEVLKEVLV